MELTIDLLKESFEKHVVAKEQVIDWMRIGNLEVRGFLYDRLTKTAYVEKIAPPLNNDEVAEFVIQYSFACIRENVYSDWADLPHIAGRQLSVWMGTWLSNKDMHPDWIQRFKTVLSQTYREGNDSVKDCIANTIIEPMLSNSVKRRLLKSWESDGTIRDAISYTEKTMK